MMKKLPKLLPVVLLILGGLAGFVAGKYLAGATKSLHWQSWQVAVILLVLLPTSWLLAVLLHELGHALVGRSQGFNFHWLAVGPFMWKKQAGRLRFERVGRQGDGKNQGQAEGTEQVVQFHGDWKVRG